MYSINAWLGLSIAYDLSKINIFLGKDLKLISFTISITMHIANVKKVKSIASVPSKVFIHLWINFDIDFLRYIDNNAYR